MPRILVVEDEPSVARAIVATLQTHGHETLVASDGETGYRLLIEEKPDAMLLDLMLPKLSGYEVCQRARAAGSRIPILMVTARNEESDLVFGLNLGADDYITKPFSVRELVARVGAALRRGLEPPNEVEILRFDDTEVDFRTFTARRAGTPVKLTRKEFGVLRQLATRTGTVVRRDTLLHEVWGYTARTATRTVDNHVASLRRKLETNPGNPLHLVTVHGVGYKWVA